MAPPPTLQLIEEVTSSQMPSSKKRKRTVLHLSDLVSFVKSTPDNFESAWYELQAFIHQNYTPAETTLASSSLQTLDEALLLFDLREDLTDTFKSVPNLPVPLRLQDNIAMIYAVTKHSHFQGNEALSRMIIDQILIYCLYEEGQQSDQRPPPARADEDSSLTPSRASDTGGPKQVAHTDEGSPHTPPRASDTGRSKPATSMPSGTSDTNVVAEEPAMLELLHETPLSRIVTHDGRTKRLNGFSDYSVWYDRSGKGKATMATNFLIVEAKRQHHTDSALPQLASYMGIVHASRKDELKENCIVYGLASDGKFFRFCRIDNDGVFTTSGLLRWELDMGKVYSIMRSLLRAAALSSPSTSPINDPMHRKVVVKLFSSPQRVQKFDYGLGQLRVYDLDDLEDVEVVSLFPGRQK